MAHHAIVRESQRGEFGACRVKLVADQRIDRNRSGLILEDDEVDLELREFRCLGACRVAGDDVDAEDLRRAFQSRSEVHLVADHRIIEPPNGP